MNKIFRLAPGTKCTGFDHFRVMPFADDVTPLISSNGDFQLSLWLFAAPCEVAGMKIIT